MPSTLIAAVGYVTFGRNETSSPVAEGTDRDQVILGIESYLGENRGDVRRCAHATVNPGADLVVGHGPHVLRGLEWYRERLIAYSLETSAREERSRPPVPSERRQSSK
jgi:Bacterial capsule synthesis protein PGA_cap